MLKKLIKLIKLIMTADEYERNYCKFSNGYINYKKMI